MTRTDIAFLLFPLISLGVFTRCRPPLAAIIVCLGGWLILPVGHYEPGPPQESIPYWIIGLALPSDMLITKAWVAPCTALLGLIAFDLGAVRRLRPVLADGLVALWCLWPLAQAAMSLPGNPPAPLASLYLAGSWGAPWLIGRICCGTAEGKKLLLQGMTISGLACLPFALVEAIAGPVFYEWLYAPHPFTLDGAQRYVGNRPIGLFEHGNQYGLWVALSAFAAVWLARASAVGRERTASVVAASVLVTMALVAQSVGAFFLLIAGVAVMQLGRWVSPRRMTIAAAALFVLMGSVFLSGAIPLRKLATETSVGRHVVDAFRSAGRTSLTWRISQDEKLLRPALKRPLTGSAQWDWWRPEQGRSWGIVLMLIGQFGLVGFGACLGLLVWPAIGAGLQQTKGSPWTQQALPWALAVIVLLALTDALLNTFIYFPALVCAGALATRARPDPT